MLLIYSVSVSRDKMKKLINIFTVIVYLCSPITGYYLKEEASKLGYISVDSGSRNYPKYGMQSMRRRQFSSGYQHNNENAVDSHFKLQTVQYIPYPPLPNLRNELHPGVPIPVGTQQQPVLVKENVEPIQQEQIPAQADKVIEKDHNIHNQQRSKHTESQGPPVPIRNRHDTKASFLSPISNDPQKYVRNRPLSMSYHRQEQKIPTVAIVDSNLKQVTGSNRNFQVMSRVLDDMTQNISDRRIRAEREYRKRETDLTSDKNKRNAISDTMRKYFVGKDKNLNLERKRSKEYSRIGSHEDLIDTNESPYAIFYRMHPNTLDDHESYIPMAMGSIEDEANFSNKKKRLSVSYDNNNKKTRYNLSLKLHKKVKNYSNYRVNNYD